MDWVLTQNREIVRRGTSIGNNPTVDKKLILPADLNLHTEDIRKIHYYSAGVSTTSAKEFVEKEFDKKFSKLEIVSINSDLLGAARAVFQNTKGIIVILGTGSNVSFYNGHKLIQDTPSLGYIMGDEGSGFDIGKAIIKAYYYNQMTDYDRLAFEMNFKHNKEQLLKSVYQEEKPNKYIASYSKFLTFASSVFKERILRKAFEKFIAARLKPCTEKYPYNVAFIGSIAYHYESQLVRILKQHDIGFHSTIKSPIDGLIDYHTKTN